MVQVSAGWFQLNKTFGIPDQSTLLETMRTTVDHYIYSNPPNTEQSSIRMVIFRTLFVSGFQMVGTGPICPDFFLASLDCFGMNKIFFYDSFLYKTV